MSRWWQRAACADNKGKMNNKGSCEISDKTRILKMGNIFGYNGSSTNFAGNVYDISQMSPSILTFPGGGYPLVIIIKKNNG